MKKNSEEFNQIFVVSFLKKLQLSGLDFQFWHTPNGGSRNKAEAGKMKLMGVLSGVPDLCVMANQEFRFIEFKKPIGRISIEQEMFISAADRYGFPVDVVIANSPEDALSQVSELMHVHLGACQNVMSSISSQVLAGSCLATGAEKS